MFRRFERIYAPLHWKKIEIGYACCPPSFDQKNIYPSPIP